MSQLEIPAELWMEIFQFLPVSTLKNVRGCCKRFRSMSQNIVWYNPTFSSQIGLEELKWMQQYHLPLKALQSSKLKPMSSRNTDETVEELVALLLACFQELQSFTLDNPLSINLKFLSAKQMSPLYKLPITHVDTTFFMRTSNSVHDIVQFLAGIASRPAIRIDASLHKRLTVDHWRDLAKLNIEQINASRLNCNSIDLQEYDRIVGSIKPRPRYTLKGDPGDHWISPDEIRKLKHVRISAIQFCAIHTNVPVDSFVTALQENDQRPNFFDAFIGNRVFRLEEFQLLCNYRITSLDSCSLDINADTVDGFVDALVECHRRTGPKSIQEFFLDERQQKCYLEHRHLEKLRSVGLIE